MQNKKQSPSRGKSPQKSDHDFQKCAYHAKQSITNFCKCEQCLLPVCPTCIKLHIDEHKIHKTSPQFEEINKVIQQIRACYEKLDESVQSIRGLLQQIQSSKKEKEQKIRKKLLDQRNILIKDFERSLIDMQNKIIDEIVKDGEEFVNGMSQLDQQLNKLENSVKKSSDNLNNDDVLKHIIIFYGKKSGQKYSRELDFIKSRALSLTQKQMAVIIDQKQLDIVTQAVQNYMKLQITVKQQ